MNLAPPEAKVVFAFAVLSRKAFAMFSDVVTMKVNVTDVKPNTGYSISVWLSKKKDFGIDKILVLKFCSDA